MCDRKSKSLRSKYEEASRQDIILFVVQPLAAEFFTMVLHTFWGSMAVSTTRPVHYDTLNR